jgi:hypothetical protein
MRRHQRAGDPNVLTAWLPANGRYTIAVAEQLLLARGARFTGGYCLGIESSGTAHDTLRPQAGVSNRAIGERRSDLLEPP